MGRLRTSHRASIWTAVLLASAGSGLAQTKLTKDVDIAPEPVAGRVLSQGTREGVGGHHMLLKGENGRTLHEIETGSDGAFRIPRLAPGTYRLQITDDLVLRLHAVPGSTIRSLDVVVPDAALAAAATGAGAGAGAASATGAAEGTSATGGLSLFGLSSTASWAVIAGGAAAVAIPVAVAASNGGSGESTVSATVSAR